MFQILLGCRIASKADARVYFAVSALGRRTNLRLVKPGASSQAYERLTRIDETWIYIAMTRIMLNRLA
jgi:hypothetical protein